MPGQSVLLALSVVANVTLAAALVSGGRAPPSEKKDSQPGAPEPLATMSGAPARESDPGCRPSYEAARAELGTLLDRATRELPVRRLFETGEPNPELAARLNELVVKRIRDAGSLDCRVECRGASCLVAADEPASAPSTWMQDLQNALRGTGALRRAQVASGIVAGTSPTGERLFESRLYLALEPGLVR
jgi:hypothetical protein